MKAIGFLLVLLVVIGLYVAWEINRLRKKEDK